jgi:hypothetical protein
MLLATVALSAVLYRLAGAVRPLSATCALLMAVGPPTVTVGIPMSDTSAQSNHAALSRQRVRQ